jgi:membrane-bound lytic murein transglycosylase MltF
LLELCKFETHFKDLITLIVTKKRQVWEGNKTSCVKYMSEVAAFFRGERNWGEEFEDADLAEYFERIANTIEEFEYSQANKVGRKIQKMLSALEDLQL